MVTERVGNKAFRGYDLYIHCTGNVPDFSKLTELSRSKWDELVNQFINEPASHIQDWLDTLVPGGSDDPRKFKDAKGRIIIIGPELPSGKRLADMKEQRLRFSEVRLDHLRPPSTKN